MAAVLLLLQPELVKAETVVVVMVQPLASVITRNQDNRIQAAAGVPPQNQVLEEQVVMVVPVL